MQWVSFVIHCTACWFSILRCKTYLTQKPASDRLHRLISLLLIFVPQSFSIIILWRTAEPLWDVQTLGFPKGSYKESKWRSRCLSVFFSSGIGLLLNCWRSDVQFRHSKTPQSHVWVWLFLIGHWASLWLAHLASMGSVRKSLRNICKISFGINHNMGPTLKQLNLIKWVLFIKKDFYLIF